MQGSDDGTPVVVGGGDGEEGCGVGSGDLSVPFPPRCSVCASNGNDQ